MTVVPSYFADQIDLSLLAFSLASIAIKPHFNQASRIVFTTLFHSYMYTTKRHSCSGCLNCFSWYGAMIVAQGSYTLANGRAV